MALYYLCSKNKGTDQLRGYRADYLGLCFRICKKPVFLKAGLLVLTIFDEKKRLNDPPSITELIPLILPVLSTQPIINHSCLQISAVYQDNLQPTKLSLGSFTVIMNGYVTVVSCSHFEQNG